MLSLLNVRTVETGHYWISSNLYTMMLCTAYNTLFTKDCRHKKEYLVLCKYLHFTQAKTSTPLTPVWSWKCKKGDTGIFDKVWHCLVSEDLSKWNLDLQPKCRPFTKPILVSCTSGYYPRANILICKAVAWHLEQSKETLKLLPS